MIQRNSESKACLALHPQLPAPDNSRYASGRFSELVMYALNPADEIVMEEIFQAGFESGENYDCCSFFEEMRHSCDPPVASLGSGGTLEVTFFFL